MEIFTHLILIYTFVVLLGLALGKIRNNYDRDMTDEEWQDHKRNYGSRKAIF